MSKVVIVTDSTADLPEDIVTELGIGIVPLRVHFGDQEEYLDWQELKPEQFYEKLASTHIMPHTSQPSPQDFVNLYKKVANPEDDIISIHISSQLSGTIQSASMARNLLPEYNIEVVDSKMTSMALGVCIIEAARAARAGKDKKEIMELINYYILNTRVYFAVDTLEYLHKNGRIGKAKALIGGLLKVKPILSLDDEGSIYPVEQVRGRKKAIDKIISIAEQNAPRKDKIIGCVLHATLPEEALIVKEKAEAVFQFQDLYFCSIGSVIGSHVGPGLLGFVCSPAKE
ncbi:MAG: DegV family protein [Dethiobacteria bacterium]|jgi:DegV family protein with EDD domain|nr:DegV family protein [Bacillota bacterium]